MTPTPNTGKLGWHDGLRLGWAQVVTVIGCTVWIVDRIASSREEILTRVEQTYVRKDVSERREANVEAAIDDLRIQVRDLAAEIRAYRRTNDVERDG